MTNRLTIILLLLLFVKVNGINAQIPVDEWRDHFPYITATSVLKANDRIFCLTPHALFYYNLEDNSVEKLSRASGLSDVGTSAMAYNDENELLLVAYENANLDFIQGSNISNLSDIKNKLIQGNKKIYHIEFQGSLAYLSCGFGIVVIDTDKREVKDTYYIGPNASSIEVYSITFDDKYIYAATESGIYFADKNSPGLVDFNIWQKITTLPFPDGKYTPAELIMKASEHKNLRDLIKTI